MSPGSLPRNPVPTPLQRIIPKTTIVMPTITRNFPSSGTVECRSAIRPCRAQAAHQSSGVARFARFQAGEIHAPGTYSVMLSRAMKDLTKAEAIANLRCVINEHRVGCVTTRGTREGGIRRRINGVGSMCATKVAKADAANDIQIQWQCNSGITTKRSA